MVQCLQPVRLNCSACWLSHGFAVIQPRNRNTRLQTPQSVEQFLKSRCNWCINPLIIATWWNERNLQSPLFQKHKHAYCYVAILSFILISNFFQTKYSKMYSFASSHTIVFLNRSKRCSLGGGCPSKFASKTPRLSRPHYYNTCCTYQFDHNAECQWNSPG